MAMPPDTPMPCIVKQTPLAGALAPSGLTLLALAELVVEEPLDGADRVLLVGAVGLELDGRAQARGEHHHAHDAFRVHAPAIFRDEDRALELRRRLGELGGCARVQARLVGDGDGALDHCGPMRITPSIAPESAFSSTDSSGSSRWVSARISMGRFTPATPSTRPARISFMAMLEGGAP